MTTFGATLVFIEESAFAVSECRKTGVGGGCGRG